MHFHAVRKLSLVPPGAADTAALRYSHHRLPAPPTPPQPALGRALPFKGCVLGPERLREARPVAQRRHVPLQRRRDGESARAMLVSAVSMLGLARRPDAPRALGVLAYTQMPASALLNMVRVPARLDQSATQVLSHSHTHNDAPTRGRSQTARAFTRGAEGATEIAGSCLELVDVGQGSNVNGDKHVAQGHFFRRACRAVHPGQRLSCRLCYVMSGCACARARAYGDGGWGSMIGGMRVGTEALALAHKRIHTQVTKLSPTIGR